MGDTERPPYDHKDYETIANNIFERLCERDKRDRESGKVANWHDLRGIVTKLRGFHVPTDVRALAEDILENEKKYMERDPHTFQVRLTELGRQNCGKRVVVTPQDKK